MAISFVAAADAHNYYTSGTLTISKPTGTIQNDLMIAVVGGTPSTLSGWTKLGGDAASGTSGGTFRVFYKLAGASEGSSYNWSITSATDAWGAIVSYRGVSTTTPVDASNAISTGSGTNFTTGSVTADGTQWLVAWASEYTFQGSGSATVNSWTTTGATNRSENEHNAGASPNREESSYVICDSNGAVSSGAHTQSLTSNVSASGGGKGALLLNPLSTSASPTAGVATVTASTAFDATSAQGVAALPGVANATGAALDGKPGVNAALLSSATAYNAAIALQGAPIAGLAEVTAGALNIGAHYGAPPGRTVKIGAESRLYRPSAESRVYVVETGGTD